MKRKLRNRSKTITFLLFAFLFAASSGKNQPHPNGIPGKSNTLVEYTYPTIYCWVDHLRIRDAASFNSNVIGKLMIGDSVMYLNEQQGKLSVTLSNNQIEGSWIKIRTFDGITGWSFSGAFHCSSMDQFVYDKMKSKIKKYKFKTFQ